MFEGFHASTVKCVEPSLNPSVFLTGGRDGLVGLWDARSGLPVRFQKSLKSVVKRFSKVDKNHVDGVSSVRSLNFAPNLFVVSFASSGDLCLFDQRKSSYEVESFRLSASSNVSLTDISVNDSGTLLYGLATDSS